MAYILTQKSINKHCFWMEIVQTTFSDHEVMEVNTDE